MGKKIILTRKTKARFYISINFFLIIICISVPLFIQSNNETEPDNKYDCNPLKYFLEECKLDLSTDEKKMQFKFDTITMINNGSFDDLFLYISKNETDIIIKEENEIYQIFSIESQLFYDNITYFDFTDWIDKNIEYLIFSQGVIVVKIEHYFIDYQIPLIEYIICPLGYGLILFKKAIIRYYIPISDINTEKLYIYNLSSEYYTDDCSHYESKFGTDISMYTRKFEYDTYNLTICPINCTYAGYNSNISRIICDCEFKDGLLSQKDVANYKNFIFKFNAQPQISNLNVLKCYYLISSVEDIKSNPGFYLTLFILFFFVLIFFIFLFIGYKSLKERIDRAVNMKFHPNQKEDDKNGKLIILKLKKNNKPNDESANSNKIRKAKTRIDKKNKSMKGDGNKLKKKKTARNLHKNTVGSRNNLILGNKGDSEKKDEEDNEDVITYIFENDYELNMLPYDQAKNCDNRKFCEMYCSFLRDRQLFLFSFFDFNSYNCSIIKKTLFFISLIYHYGINAFFFTDETMEKIYGDEGKYSPRNLMPYALSSAIICTTLLILNIKFLVSTEKYVLNIKNQATEEKAKEEKNRVLKIICVKFIFFFFLNFLLLFFFWFYLTCFNAVYPKTQIFLLINTVVSLIISHIIPFIYCFIPAILRKDILINGKQRKTKKNSKTNEDQANDAKYVYTVSQFFLKI